MPEVIDNIKVGEYIKTLLEKHNMTQNDLAQKLNISRSAVSQNLNGKSTFDLQNLMRISEIFSISLDQLLQSKSSKDDGTVSEYERLLKKGLTEIKKISPSKINIASPDLYGKAFIEYVIDYEDKELFTYLVDNNYSLYDKEHTHAAEVLEKIILFCAENQTPTLFVYIKEYIQLFGALNFSNDESEKNFYQSLEVWPDDTIKKRLLTETVQVETPFLKIFRKMRNQRVLSTIDWATMIGKYHLDSFLSLFIQTHVLVPFFDRIVECFVRYGYQKGCEEILVNLPKNEVAKLKKKNQIMQNTAILVSTFDQISLLEEFLVRGIISNHTELLIEVSKSHKKEMVIDILDKYKVHIDFKTYGATLVEDDQLLMLKHVSEYFPKDTLDFMLGKVSPNQLDMQLYLIQQGASFQVKYFNRDTAKKVNALIKHYQESKVSK